MNVVEMLSVAINLKNAEINQEKATGQFVPQRVPNQISEADVLFYKVVDEYSRLSITDKKSVCKSVTTEMAWYLLGFGVNMATYSLRLSEQRYFTNGLFAIGMTLGILDRREILVVLPLYCDVQKKHGLSFGEILRQNSDFSSVLRDFINRNEKDKSLECMGYVLEVDESNNPIYRRTW